MMKRTPVYCDCHGTEVMGYRVLFDNGEERIVMSDRRHGLNHLAVVPLSESRQPEENVVSNH